MGATKKPAARVSLGGGSSLAEPNSGEFSYAEFDYQSD